MKGWTKEALANEIVRLAAPDSDPNSARGQKAVERLLSYATWDQLADRFHESVGSYLVLNCEWYEETLPGRSYQRVYQVI